MPKDAIGSVHVFNNCSETVYQHVSGFKNGRGWDGPTLPVPRDGFHMPHDTSVSVKLFRDPAMLQGSITQVETNYDKEAERLYYDMSNVDAFRTGSPPFMEGGMLLTTTGEKDARYPTCLDIYCPKGELICKDAYNHPRDDKTMACPRSTDLHVTLCPGGEDQSPVGRSIAITQLGNIERPREGGRPEDHGHSGKQPPVRVSRPARSLDAGTEKDLSPKRSSAMTNGLAKKASSGHKKHLAKLPVVSAVASIACYLIATL